MDEQFFDFMESIERSMALLAELESTPFYLDHIIVPGGGDGDRRYENISAVPKVGEGVHGFYNGDPYLFRVVGFTFYEAEVMPVESKAIGALLLAPVMPSDLHVIKNPA